MSKCIRLYVGHKFASLHGVKLQWTDTQVRQVVKQLVIENCKNLAGYTITQGNLGMYLGKQEKSTVITFIVNKDDPFYAEELNEIKSLKTRLEVALFQYSVLMVTSECEVSF